MNHGKDWISLTHTRAILVCVSPTLPEFFIHQRLAEVDEMLMDIQGYCDEMDIEMPAVAASIDSTGLVEITHATPMDRMRFYQILSDIQVLGERFRREDE